MLEQRPTFVVEFLIGEVCISVDAVDPYLETEIPTQASHFYDYDRFASITVSIPYAFITLHTTSPQHTPYHCNVAVGLLVDGEVDCAAAVDVDRPLCVVRPIGGGGVPHGRELPLPEVAPRRCSPWYAARTRGR